MTEAPARNIRVFLIDDEENMVRILSKILSRQGYEVTPFTEPAEALKRLEQERPDLVVTDIAMPDIDGMEVMARVHRALPQTKVLMMTAYGTIDGAIRALKEGAFDYVTKPFETRDLLKKVERAAEGLQAAEASAEALSSDPMVTPPPGTVNDWEAELRRRLVGESDAIAKVREVIEKVAPTDSSILLRGESGTGKELVARAIHDASPRHHHRLVAINCAAIPQNLIESELFGHEVGAFTGAVKQKIGIIEAADEGTLFLDEIGELPMEVQGRLLRVLQDRKIQRLGGIDTKKVDVRILAATNRNLEEMIREGAFRADLFYRLNVIRIQLPALRDRLDDIEPLAEALLKRLCRKRNKVIHLTPEIVQLFRAYSWPGNVRELENVLERLLVLSEDGEIQPDMLPPEIQFGEKEFLPSGMRKTPVPTQFRDARNQFERRYITDLLRKSGGSITHASQISGISRRNLYDKIQKLNIDLVEFKR